MLLKATISSHRSGKERFGAQEVFHCTKDYLLSAGNFGHIQKMGCCLGSGDRSFRDQGNQWYHIQYNRTGSLLESLKEDIPFERVCECSLKKERLVIFPKIMVFKTKINHYFRDEPVIQIGELLYKLSSVVFFNAPGPDNNPRNHFFICIQVCYLCITVYKQFYNLIFRIKMVFGTM